MKRFLTIALTLTLMLFTACEAWVPSKGLKDVDSYDPDDFQQVKLQRITMSAKELHTIPGTDPLLTYTKFPAFANFEDTMRWASSDTSVATVDPVTGKITVRTEPVTGSPLKTIISVASEEDPSVRGSAVLTVYPEYPNRRRWFAAQNGLVTSAAERADYAYDSTTAGTVAQGGTLLTGTGGFGVAEGGSLAGGPGLYTINPENPYEFGIPKPGATLNGLVWNTGSWTIQSGTHNWARAPFYRAPANYYTRADPSDTGSAALPNIGVAATADSATASAGHARVGAGGRFMSIAALQGPFTVIVNYVNNGSAERTVGIRLGDTDSGIYDPATGKNRPGVLKEGEMSPNYNASDDRSVWYNHYEAEFVPIIYLEAYPGNMRIYDVYVLDEVLYQYNQVPNAFTISGDDIPVGTTAQFGWQMGSATGTGAAVNYTPWLHNPIIETEEGPNKGRPKVGADGKEISSTEYEWTVTPGTGSAEIVGANNGATVTIRGVASGTVTLELRIKTYNPNKAASFANPTPAPDKERTSTKTVTIQ